MKLNEDETMTDAAVAKIGDNNPPEQTPFEQISDTINDLYTEAKHWLDGDPVASQDQADAINTLINLVKDAAVEADELRKTENAPFDEGKAEVQARYAPLIAKTKGTKGKTVMALEAAKAALTPWLEKLDAQKRETERAAREEADAAQKAAEEAFQNSQVDDLAAREAAEKLAEVAKRANATAAAAEKDKAHAKGGTGRATGLRTTYRAEITDMTEFARWYWANRQSEMMGIFNECAAKLVAQNHEIASTVPGLTVHEERKAV